MRFYVENALQRWYFFENEISISRSRSPLYISRSRLFQLHFISTHIETTISSGYFFKENPMVPVHVPVPERHPAGVTVAALLVTVKLGMEADVRGFALFSHQTSL